VEGHIEGVTGWCIGESRRTAAGNTPADNTAEAESLYNKLEGVILPMYYNDRAKFLEVMQHAIAINGSFFNTQRMVQQYITDAYLR
jgi:starch phosphorylase